MNWIRRAENRSHLLCCPRQKQNRLCSPPSLAGSDSLMYFDCKLLYYPTPWEPHDFLRSLTIDVVCSTELDDDVIGARLDVDELDILRASIAGESIYQVCDSDSGGCCHCTKICAAQALDASGKVVQLSFKATRYMDCHWRAREKTLVQGREGGAIHCRAVACASSSAYACSSLDNWQMQRCAIVSWM